MPRIIAFADARAARGAGREWILAALACLLCAASLIYLSPLAENPDYWPAISVGAGVTAAAAIGLLRVNGFRWRSAPIVYIAFVWMFHFPTALILHVVPGSWTQVSAQIYGWTQSASWYRASLYALLCVIAFAIGCVAARSSSRPGGATSIGTNAVRCSVGAATAVGGLAWLYVLIYRAGGLDLYGSGYAQLYTTIFGSDFSISVFLVSAGSFLVLTSCSRKLMWLPFVLQLAASIPVLLTGARQFALIGPLVLVVLAARRGIRMSFPTAAISCAMVLWTISYVGETRNRGVAEGIAAAGSIGPAPALMEMGASLQTTRLAHEWIQNGDSYLLGGSYWLPFERALGIILPLRKELATDGRAMNMLLVSRVAGLGGSAIAESYYNFSVFGALFFLALGALLARFDATVGGFWTDVLAVALYAFLFQARNWFISVPLFILVGLLPLLASTCLEAIVRRRAARRGAARVLAIECRGISRA